jgi:FAD/FMN-containing dehydrogenase
VLPDQPFKVAVALKVVTFTGSKFAVRAGGHNPNAGFASIDGSGVLIDLVKLNTLELSADQKSIKVGPGNRWGAVQNYLSPYKISAVGGRNKGVGVAGVLLGGGYPNINSLTGMACDSVKNFEV